jgi:hypothetical protein
MTTYRKIHGRAIKSVSTNLSAPSAEGQIWFNTTDNKFRSVVAFDATRSGSLMSTTRGNAGSFGSTRDASALAGGYTSTANTNVTEEYNGSGFSSGGNLNNSRRALHGTGVITAGLVCGGYESSESNKTEEYDGSAFSNGGTLNTSRFFPGTFGTQTAGVAAGGNQPSPAKNATEEYNGSSWTTVPATLSNGRENHMAGGTETAGIVCGGDNATPTIQSATEEYDGSSWTAGGNLNTARAGIQGSGIQTAAIVMGGNTPTRISSIEIYNGTSWTTSPATLATARDGAHNAGTSTSAIVSGGITPGPSYVNTSEEFDKSINTITAAAWSSGTALPGVRWNTSGAGTQTAGLIFGGATGPGTPTFLNTTFEYDGSSWTAGGSTPNSSINQFSAGIQTAAIGGGGLASGGSNTAEAYTYNGTSWTGITATPEVTKGAGGAGTSTACLIYGSDTPGPINQDSYSWNGSSWSEEGAMNTSFQNGAAGGPTENTAFKAGSLFGGPETSTNFETYNGSAWTAGSALITTAAQNRGFGSSAECLSIGGFNKITPVERYDGTAWHTSPSLATGRKQFASANFTAPGVSNGWVGGGADGDSSVEHFTEETTSLGVKDLTQSS